MVLYVTNEAKTCQLDLRLSLRDRTITACHQIRGVCSHRAMQRHKDKDYDLSLAGRNQCLMGTVTNDISLGEQGIRAEDLLMAAVRTTEPQAPEATSPAQGARAAEAEIPGSLAEAGLMPIEPVWGVTFKVWPAHDGDAVFHRNCSIPMDATWRNVRDRIQRLMEKPNTPGLH